MSYVAIYRNFRPQTFAQVKGQDSIVRTLKNQVKNGRMGHAYLFTGTRGTGKTSVARIFAKAINCTDPKDGEPCNQCENCKAISSGSFMDVIEIDAASNTGVDDIRRVIEEVQYSPVTGKYKVYIIDEAHMLSTSASNAFLKTLEEPPEYAVFILATTEPHKLPVTILSRCQRYDFKRITTDKISENIFEYLNQENIEAEEKAVNYIARIGDGSMRDALSLLDKAIAFNLGSKLTYENTLSALGTVETEVFSEMYHRVLKSDAYGAVSILDNEIRNGKDISRFVNDFVWYLRNLLLINADGGDADILGLSDENFAMLKKDAENADPAVLMRYIRILSELSNQLKFSNARQVLADVAVIKLAKPQMETDSESVLDRIRQLEEKLENASIHPLAAGNSAGYPAGNAVNSQAEARPVFAASQQAVSGYMHREPADNMAAQESRQNSSMPEETWQEPADIYEYDLQNARMYMDNSDHEDPMPGNETADMSRNDPAGSYTTENPAAAQATEASADPPQIEENTENIVSPEPAAENNTAGNAADNVCRKWQEVVAACTSPILKVYLKDTKVSASGDNIIDIIAPSDIALARLESKRNELREIIKGTTGCSADVRILTEKDATANSWKPFGDIAATAAAPGNSPVESAGPTEEEKIESLLKQNIMMNIETEDA